MNDENHVDEFGPIERIEQVPGRVTTRPVLTLDDVTFIEGAMNKLATSLLEDAKRRVTLRDEPIDHEEVSIAIFQHTTAQDLATRFETIRTTLMEASIIKAMQSPKTLMTRAKNPQVQGQTTMEEMPTTNEDDGRDFQYDGEER